jgi:hypothetical protein
LRRIGHNCGINDRGSVFAGTTSSRLRQQASNPYHCNPDGSLVSCRAWPSNDSYDSPGGAPMLRRAVRVNAPADSRKRNPERKS